MIITVPVPPQALRISLEPTERRSYSIDFSPVLSDVIASIGIDDPSLVVIAWSGLGTRAVQMTIQAPAAAATSTVTLLITTASGRRERLVLTISIVDPASGIEEIAP